MVVTWHRSEKNRTRGIWEGKERISAPPTASSRGRSARFSPHCHRHCAASLLRRSGSLHAACLSPARVDAKRCLHNQLLPLLPLLSPPKMTTTTMATGSRRRMTPDSPLGPACLPPSSDLMGCHHEQLELPFPHPLPHHRGRRRPRRWRRVRRGGGRTPLLWRSVPAADCRRSTCCGPPSSRRFA